MPTLVAQAPNEITIAWIAPGDNGMPIISYDIYWNGGTASGRRLSTSIDYIKIATVGIIEPLEYTNTDVTPG
jgi:hypothetical protein